MTAVIRVQQLRKEFGAILALDGMTLDIDAGEVVALVGDNGAGKSTLVRCLAGLCVPTAGQIMLDGATVRFAHPGDARRNGIEVVLQELALADLQPVYMNVFLGRELVRRPVRRLDRRGMAAATQRLLESLEVRVDSPHKIVRELSGGQRQAVAIARAVHWAKRVVLMDEPTASLGATETQRVEELIGRLRERGTAILVVSHSLDQVFRIADRICVLRRGRQIGVRTASETTAEEILAMITGLA
jgi:simple sugar transport system ATP-binding protein